MISDRLGSASSRAMRFALVALVVNLHLIRNVSLPAYLVLYGVVAVMVIMDCLHLRRTRPDSLFWLWCTVAFFGAAVTSAISGADAGLYGLSRFLFCVPIYLAFVAYTRDRADFARHLLVLLSFFTVAALTIPLQYFTGPISWFPDASERGGLERFSSLTGSLPSIGAAIGYYVLLLGLHPTPGRIVLVSCIVVGGVASLNKSAIVNLAIALIVLIFAYRRSLGRILLIVAGVAPLLLAGIFMSPFVYDRLAVSLQSFGLSVGGDSAVANYDDTVLESAISRMTELPLANYDALAEIGTSWVYFTGGGFGMASTALVSSADSLAPMAHNQYPELLTVFGPVGGMLLIGAMLALLPRVWAASAHAPVPVRTTLLGIVMMFLVNSLAANGTVYQPASGTIFFLLVFIASHGGVLYARPGSAEPEAPRILPAFRRSASR